MSVELLDSPRFHGFRVRRQIGGRTYQEYFPLKANGKRLRGAKRAALKVEAEARDAELERLQVSTKERVTREVKIDKKGQVRGILFRLKKEKSGFQTPVFQIGIMSYKLNKIVNTTVSINMHGMEGAWHRAVDFFCEHRNISKRSKGYRALLAARPSKTDLRKLERSLGR